MASQKNSAALFDEARRLIPGGVNSPVRAFRAVGGQPFFVHRAQGARVWSVDGQEWIDYVCTWGPSILGHAHVPIVEAVRTAALNGTSFGIPNPFEVEMARTVCEAVPSVEMVRMCNSGTEATMSAIRLARGFTGREKIIKFQGCYHGHADSLLVNAGSGALTFGNPDSAGVPPSFTEHTVVVPFNDEPAVRNAMEANRGKVAGIILEPVCGNAGVYLPKPGFLEMLRTITQEHDALLIFDEVMTGFRLDWGGAQERFGVQPDLSCFGKVIGGGLPVGAFGGRRDIMECLAPVGPVYQAGTLSGNPLAMAAGLAALKELRSRNAYKLLEERGQQLEEGLNRAAKHAGVPAVVNRCGSMICTFFTGQPVWNLEDAKRSDTERFKRFFHGMLNEGIYFAPSQFEAGFLSAAHEEADILQTIQAAEKVMKTL